MFHRIRVHRTSLVALALAALAGTAAALPVGDVRTEQKISASEGAFGGSLDNGDLFGTSLAVLGDLDGDGVTDVAVGARRDDDGGSDIGAIWILFLNANGTVKAETKIASGTGGFTGQLDVDDGFGQSLANLGDVDGDGVTDLAAGAPRDDDGGISRGAVWILFLKTDGTVKGHKKVTTVPGGFFDPTLKPNEDFGAAVAGPGDVDGNGVRDLVVGAPLHANGGLSQRGAIWVLFLDASGTVIGQQKISTSAGSFGGALSSGDRFGGAIAAFGDLDGNAVTDLVVGADGDDDGGTDKGAVWILELASNGTVLDENKISDTSGSFQGVLAANDRFGRAVAAAGDDDGNGRPDVLVGGTGTQGRGEVWVLHLNGAGNVIDELRIADGAGGFGGDLSNQDGFGAALGSLGELDIYGENELIAGAPADDDAGTDRGGVWILFRGDLPDCDGDGTPDRREPDCDGDGIPDDCEVDCDADGLPDDCEVDCDLDGIPDDCERDCDLDGIPDDCEPDCDADGIPDDCEPDCDSDGLPDACEAADCDGDGLPDECEADCDGDGLPDDCELDCNADGVPDECEADCDADGVPDGCEIDCDDDGVPDDCEPDCDGDGTPDDCERDCDLDGTPDGCEPDCDLDGLPDDCEPDCDGDGIPDDCDPICTGDPPDGVTIRNGSGVNRECFTTSSEPLLGQNWVSVVDTTTHSLAFFSFILIYDQPAQLATPFGELLILGGEILFTQAPLVDGIGVHVVALPNAGHLDGVTVYTQALFSSGGGPVLCNALDITLHL